MLLLSTFSILPLNEQKLMSRLESITRGTHPIKIELRNFGSLPSHTIFLNITPKVPVLSLVKELKKVQAFMKADNDHKPYFIDEAILPVCKKLKPWQYEKAWLAYSHFDFSSRFIAGNINILRRTGGQMHFEKIRVFELAGIDEKIAQGDLFN
jgi:hypothetical protein